MNWTELLNSDAAKVLYGFLGNTLVTYLLKSTASRNLVIVVLKAIVGALEKAAPAAIILLAIGLQGCAAWVPTPTTPCAGLYCLEWDGTSAGLPADVLICAKTEQEALEAVQPLLEAYPKSVARKASK